LFCSLIQRVIVIYTDGTPWCCREWYCWGVQKGTHGLLQGREKKNKRKKKVKESKF